MNKEYKLEKFDAELTIAYQDIGHFENKDDFNKYVKSMLAVQIAQSLNIENFKEIDDNNRSVVVIRYSFMFGEKKIQ